MHRRMAWLFGVWSGWLSAAPVVVVYDTSPNNALLTEQLVFTALQQELTGYRIDIEAASVERALKSVLVGRGTCVRNLVKTSERQAQLVFSQPTTFFLGLRVFASPEFAHTFEIYPYSLTELVALKPKALLGVDQDRSYGEEMDKQFQTLPSKNVYFRAGQENESLLHDMLLSQRLDLLIEYPSVVQFFNVKKHIPQAKQPIMLPLTTSQPLQFGHLACANTALGRQVIQQVDRLLSQFYQTSAYWQWHLDFIATPYQTEFLQKTAIYRPVTPLKSSSH